MFLFTILDPIEKDIIDKLKMVYERNKGMDLVVLIPRKYYVLESLLNETCITNCFHRCI